MKRSLILLCAVLMAAVAAPRAMAQGQPGDSLPIDFMYDALSPYGDWIYTPNYGYVWQPLVSQNPGWAPYADGSWAYTDAGWTWISNEDFGWLTYHYGRWIRLQQSWMWVPGSQWAPAWVSWRQTQWQTGWAPLPPEAMWSQNVGFGNWTDSYYDVGPAYYNFVPNGMFANSGSMMPFIHDRSQNFVYYNQSVNVTNTSYQPNVMNHIFVGGPEPQRINGMGGKQVRRLTLRHDEEGFRHNWLDRPGGGPPRGTGGQSRIEQGQLVVAAPSFRQGASQALPSRVRESLQKPVVDRGWQGAADVEAAQRLRMLQHDDLARTRPATLPEKRVLPATSTTPPPATGRVLSAEERLGLGGHAVAGGTMPPSADPRGGAEDPRQPMTPRNPLPADGPPGTPPRGSEALISNGTAVTPTEHPRRESVDFNPPTEQRPGMQAGQMPRHPEPQAPPPVGGPPGILPRAGEAPNGNGFSVTPTGAPAPGMQPGFPGHRQGQPPGNGPAERPHFQPPVAPPSVPAAPPRAATTPMPPQQQLPQQQRPQQQQQRPERVQPPQQPQVQPAVPNVPQQEPGGRRKR